MRKRIPVDSLVQNFIKAAFDGDLAEVQRMIEEKKVDINAQLPNGDTALHMATQKGGCERTAHKEIIQLLLDSGSNIDIPGSNSITPYQMAKTSTNKVLDIFDKHIQKATQTRKEYLEKTAEILESSLTENKFQTVTVSENKLTVGFSKEIKHEPHKISLHIDLPAPVPESKINPAAGILEELLTLSVDDEIVQASNAIFQKIDFSYVDLEGKPAQRITVRLAGDIESNPAKTQKLLNFIYGLTPSHQSSRPSIKFDDLTLDKTPLFKELKLSSPEHIKAVSTLDKLLQSYLELLYDKSDTIKKKFKRDGSPLDDKSSVQGEVKIKEGPELDRLMDHKMTRFLLNILREDHFPKSKLDQFVKFFEANKDRYFKTPSPSRFPALFKPTNVRNEIENCLSKLPKEEFPTPKFN